MSKTEAGISRNKMIADLTKSPHGDLSQYIPVGVPAAQQDPEFFAHLVAWNHARGQIKDAKAALPVIALTAGVHDYDENALAHLAELDPRTFARALDFVRVANPQGGRKKLVRSLVEKWLRFREENRGLWDRVVLQHRSTMKMLYTKYHIKPAKFAQEILFEGRYADNSVFAAVKNLKDMSAEKAAAAILKHKIPFLVVLGSLGNRLKDPDILLALMERMSPTEFVTHAAQLEKLGVKNVPALRSAYESKLVEVAESKKATFKTSVAAKKVTDEKTKVKLQAAQEKQIASLGKIDGDYLILVDRSGSMKEAIEAGRLIAATLAKTINGQVHMVFQNTEATYYNVTGKSYDEILTLTRGINDFGGTSLGVGVRYALDKKLDVDCIVHVSDAQENNNPFFVDQYQRLCAKLGDKDIPVYLYRMNGAVASWADKDLARSMKVAGLELSEFDLRGGVDYYSLPNLVLTMRANRSSLADEIMETPLKTLAEVFTAKQSKTAVA